MLGGKLRQTLDHFCFCPLSSEGRASPILRFIQQTITLPGISTHPWDGSAWELRGRKWCYRSGFSRAVLGRLWRGCYLGTEKSCGRGWDGKGARQRGQWNSRGHGLYLFVAIQGGHGLWVLQCWVGIQPKWKQNTVKDRSPRLWDM